MTPPSALPTVPLAPEPSPARDVIAARAHRIAAMPGEEVHPSTEISSVNELLIGWGSATVYPPLDHSEAAAPIDEQLSERKSRHLH